MDATTPTSNDEPRSSLASWLRAGRAHKKLSLEEVARITKIQARILEKLESGQHEGLPADVFVRGFVRSFARCVGLDETEALARLGDCAKGGAGAVVAKALVQTMAPAIHAEPEADTSVVVVVPQPAPAPPKVEVVQVAAIEVVEAVEVVETTKPTKKSRRKKPAGTTPPRGKRRKAGNVDAVVAVEAEGSTSMLAMGSSESIVDDIVPDAPVVEAPAIDVVDLTATPWTPTMPPTIPGATPSVPWRRGFQPSAAAKLPASPSLVIDDADPDVAERVQSRRDAAKDQRVSFLPPILLDREDRSQRQGGLTLAVIILLIAATLTLSYLMRRPTVSGDGVTMRETPATLA